MPGIDVFAATGPVSHGGRGAWHCGAWGKACAKPLHSCDFCAGTSPLPSGLAFRVTPAGRRAWFGGIFKGAEADFSMKVTVERAELLKSLGHVHRVVERRNTIPILANVLVKADRGKLSLKATDLDLEVTDSIAAEVSPGGSTTVPAHMFYEIVRKLPEGSQIVLEGSGDRAVLALRAGRSRFTLQTLPESDFPDLAAGEMSHSFKLAAADLKRLIDKTQFAISTEETRYYLNGIYLHVAGTAKSGTLRAVATDGHRLAQVELPLPQGAAGMPGIIVPRKTVGEVQRSDRNRRRRRRRRTLQRQNPFHDRQRRAHLKADRRHLP